MVQPLQQRVWQSLWKAKHTLVCPSHSTAAFVPKRKGNICLEKDKYIKVNGSFICNSWKLKITQMFTNRQINKLWYTHSMEYYSAIKRNELLIHKTWIYLKNIMLSEEFRYYKYIMYDAQNKTPIRVEKK